MPDSDAMHSQLNSEVARIAGIIWREFQLSLTGQAPPPGLWNGRLLVWWQAQPENTDPIITAAWKAAVSIKTITAGA